MLQEKGCKEFFNAMLEEIEVHDKCEHWTLMNRNDMPTGAKTIITIWSFKINQYPYIYVLTADNKPGAKTIGIFIHRSSHGLVYDYY